MAEPKNILDFPHGSEQGFQGRVPPQAIDIEAAVLGAMLIEKEAIAKVLEVLDEDAFYKPAHGMIYKGMISLFDRSEPVDLITLSEELKRRGDLEKVGGEVALAALTQNVTTAANVEYHAHIVLEKSLMRQLISTSADVMSKYQPTIRRARYGTRLNKNIPILNSAIPE